MRDEWDRRLESRAAQSREALAQAARDDKRAAKLAAKAKPATTS